MILKAVVFTGIDHVVPPVVNEPIGSPSANKVTIVFATAVVTVPATAVAFSNTGPVMVPHLADGVPAVAIAVGERALLPQALPVICAT